MKSLYDVMVCPNCRSDNCYDYATGETEIKADGMGHHCVDCHCKECGTNFRLHVDFEYRVEKSYARCGKNVLMIQS